MLLRRNMNTTIDLIQQKLRDLTNRLDLLSNKGVGGISDSNLCSTVSTLKNEVSLIKQQVSSLQTSITEVQNQYSSIVTNVDNCNAKLESLTAIYHTNLNFQLGQSFDRTIQLYRPINTLC